MISPIFLGRYPATIARQLCHGYHDGPIFGMDQSRDEQDPKIRLHHRDARQNMSIKTCFELTEHD